MGVQVCVCPGLGVRMDYIAQVHSVQYLALSIGHILPIAVHPLGEHTSYE
jgi:hypothetical protein